jgi:hypothetical protein
MYRARTHILAQAHTPTLPHTLPMRTHTAMLDWAMTHGSCNRMSLHESVAISGDAQITVLALLFAKKNM